MVFCVIILFFILLFFSNFQIDNVNAFESTAILRYMANRFPIEDHWYPKDPAKRVKVDSYLGKHKKSLKSRFLLNF
jgi:hypothetical protein